MKANLTVCIFSAFILLTVGFGCATSNETLAAQLGVPVPVRDPQPVPAGYVLGKGEVRAMHGKAKFSLQGDEWFKLRVKTVLRPGAAIWTGTDSSIDLFLGANGPVIRLLSNSLLVIDSLAYRRADSETTIDTRFFLQKGQMLGNVKKLAVNSRYEVRTPKSLMRVQGTDYDISADGRVVVVTGRVDYDFGGKNYVLNTAEVFDPIAGKISKIDSMYYLQKMQRRDPPPQPPPSGWPQRKF